MPVDGLVEARGALDGEANAAAAEESALEHLGPQPHAGHVGRPREEEPGARLELRSGMHERVPRVGVHALEQETLGRAAARISPADAIRAGNTRLSLATNPVARRQERRQILDMPVAERPRGAVHDEQSRGAARPRLLRDECRRQLEVEVGDPRHRRDHGTGHAPIARGAWSTRCANAMGIEHQQAREGRDDGNRRCSRRGRARPPAGRGVREREVVAIRAPEHIARPCRRRAPHRSARRSRR